MVAAVSSELDVAHRILTVHWKAKPETAIQERARAERYSVLDAWAGERGFAAIATAHHLDDQVETLVMRLNRGAGVRGLAGIRPVAAIPGGKSAARLIRPLLGWRRTELVDLCNKSGLAPVDDPSNRDEQFERVRVRAGLAEAPWLDSEAVARSASNLAGADSALEWASDVEWERQVSQSDSQVSYVPVAPLEIRRRIVRRAIDGLANEGLANPLRGGELDRLLALLSKGGTATIRGVLCSGGKEWRFSPAPRRRSS
jgi:tRNA(Ile)-lysidine synthase